MLILLPGHGEPEAELGPGPGQHRGKFPECCHSQHGVQPGETTELVFYLGCCAVRNGTLPQVRVQVINGFSFVQLKREFQKM